MKHEAPKPTAASRLAPRTAATVQAEAAPHRYAGAAAVRGAAAARTEVPAAGAASALHGAAQRLSAEFRAPLAQAAAQTGIAESALAAVVLAEGQYLPREVPGMSDALPIRFEPYLFFQQTGRWLAATHRDQAAEYRVFEQARALDDGAAHRSLRMGMAQVGGHEAEAAGFASAHAMRSAMAADPAVQLAAWTSLVAAEPGLQQALQQQDWTQVALLRAGQGYGALGYDQALVAADAAWRQVVQPGGGDDDESKKRRKKA